MILVFVLCSFHCCTFLVGLGFYIYINTPFTFYKGGFGVCCILEGTIGLQI